MYFQLAYLKFLSKSRIFIMDNDIYNNSFLICLFRVEVLTYISYKIMCNIYQLYISSHNLFLLSFQLHNLSIFFFLVISLYTCFITITVKVDNVSKICFIFIFVRLILVFFFYLCLFEIVSQSIFEVLNHISGNKFIIIIFVSLLLLDGLSLFPLQ